MRFVAAICAFFLLSSCGKEPTGIPYVPVDYRITVQEFGIKNNDGVLLVNGHGVAGLIIYRNGNNYTAYDRCSTVNPEKRCPVIRDPESSFTLLDTCSGGKFLLLDGSPQKAPAKRNLKQYSITISNNSLIQVSN